MQEDKNLKALLVNHAMEETAEDFTAAVMQRIDAAIAAKTSVVPLLDKRLLRLLAGLFILACIASLVLAIAMQPGLPAFHFPTAPAANDISKGLWFILIFWGIFFVSRTTSPKRFTEA